MKSFKDANKSHVALVGLFFLLSILFLFFPELLSSKHQVISMRFVAIFTLAAMAYYGYEIYKETDTTHHNHA